MIKTLSTAAALSLAVLGTQAAAVTLNGDNNIVDGGNRLLSQGPFNFGAAFDIGDPGDIFTFSFTNDLEGAQALTITAGTVAQNTAAFTGGVDFTFGEGGASLGQGQPPPNNGFIFNNNIAAGATETLTVSFGDVINTGGPGGSTDIDFTVDVAAIPLPAAGLLLVGALGGLGLLRRRKAA